MGLMLEASGEGAPALKHYWIVWGLSKGAATHAFPVMQAYFFNMMPLFMENWMRLFA